MGIENLRFWQWALIGIFVGGLFSGMLTLRGPWYDNDELETINSQGEFERDVLYYTPRPTMAIPPLVKAVHKDEPMVKDLIVHPPLPTDKSQTWWVTGQYFKAVKGYTKPDDASSPMAAVGGWHPFKFPTVAPYVPGYASKQAKDVKAKYEAELAKKGTKGADMRLRGRWQGEVQANDAIQAMMGGAEQFPNVQEYLKQVAAINGSKVTSTLAWWEDKRFLFTLPPLAGLLVIGCCCPLGIGILQSVGLAKVPTVAVKKADPPKPVAAIKPAPRPVGPAVVVKPPEPAAPVADTRKYGGVYYPVVKTDHKD